MCNNTDTHRHRRGVDTYARQVTYPSPDTGGMVMGFPSSWWSRAGARLAVEESLWSGSRVLPLPTIQNPRTHRNHGNTERITGAVPFCCHGGLVRVCAQTHALTYTHTHTHGPLLCVCVFLTNDRLPVLAWHSHLSFREKGCDSMKKTLSGQ